MSYQLENWDICILLFHPPRKLFSCKRKMECKQINALFISPNKRGKLCMSTWASHIFMMQERHFKLILNMYQGEPFHIIKHYFNISNLLQIRTEEKSQKACCPLFKIYIYLSIIIVQLVHFKHISNIRGNISWDNGSLYSWSVDYLSWVADCTLAVVGAVNFG